MAYGIDFDDVRTKAPHDPYLQYDGANNPLEETGVHPLDEEPAREKLNQFKEWWYECRTQQAPARYEMAIDADFYDGIQWSDSDTQELKERGQPALVFNKINTYINWIIGTERRTRIEAKAYPREDNDVESAQTKSKLIRYVNDVNHAPFARSRAFKDAVTVGVGWLEDGIRSDPSDEPLFSRSESWRNIWYDALSREQDLTDARFMFRAKWVDLDIAIAMFPDRKAALEAAAVSHNLFYEDEDEDISLTGMYSSLSDQAWNNAGWRSASAYSDGFHVGIRRQRVRLIECWYRQPAEVGVDQVVRTYPDKQTPPDLVSELLKLNGSSIDNDNVGRITELQEQGYASLYDSTRMSMHVAMWCGDSLLQDSPSPYKHRDFPFTPIWAYRRDRDNSCYGPVRNMRDPQEDLNKRRSKALFILSTRGMTADEDAFEDWDEAEEELGRPNFILKKKRGSDVELHMDTEVAQEHVELMREDKLDLESAGGVTDENLGQDTNAVSGKAILARQNQGSVTTASLFDNLRFGVQIQGEKQLSMIEQFYDAPKVVRLTDERGNAEFVNVNMPFADEQGMPQIENDIQANAADFIVDQQDYRESIRIAMFEQLMEMVSGLPPEIGIQLLDLVLDVADVPGKEEMVRRVRKINGHPDPDAEDHDEEVAAAEAAEAEQGELERAQIEGAVAEQIAKADSTSADAQSKRSDTLLKTIEIASHLAMNPELARAADKLFEAMSEPTQ